MERFNPRVGHLASVALHLVIVIALINRPRPAQTPETVVREEVPASRARVFLPPPAVLRALGQPPLPRTAASIPPPAPPTPPPAVQRDSIRVGAGQPVRGSAPLDVSRSVTAPKGDDLPRTGASPVPSPASEPSQPAAAATPAPSIRRAGGGDAPLVAPTDAAPQRPSLASSLRHLGERAAGMGPGLPTGSGQGVPGLFFDPQGADFTEWTNHFGRETERNWVAPMAVFLARHAETIVDFTVQRDGKVTEIGLVKSCGIVALDRAVRNTILSSRLRPLPADYGPATVTFRLAVTFDASPQGS